MFEQAGSVVYCDEAEYNTAREELTGRGNVRISSSEGVVITGSSLFYNGKTKNARVDGNVVLRDKGMTLTTPWISYQTDSRIGYYGSGGRIVDGDQVLTSRTGSYNPNLRMLYFRHNVNISHPDYTVATDTLQYSSESGTAWFFNYTEINLGDNTILCNYGRYNTKTGESHFTRNAAILSKENIIRADTLDFDRNSGIGKAKGRLWVKDTSQNIIIFGQKGHYDRNRKYTLVEGKPLARKYEKNGDSLMLKADTFIYHDDSILKKRFLLAYSHVELWRQDFSGTADSLSYVAEDSLFRLFGKPVLWNANSRLNADTMRMWLKNSRISLMQMRGKSFVATKEDQTQFSQISGDNMDNRFDTENKLRSVWVRGHGQSVYFIREKDSVVSSANRVQYNNMLIALDSGRVNEIRFYGQPEGIIYPIDMLPGDKQKLPGFVWDEENRPKSERFTAPFSVPELPKRRTENGEKPKTGKSKRK
jgi:lipopolysaccharide export system protein LptA